ncbi:hypothetical protein [Clostridium beijerinckii]|uniref:hypothetical protein n=1 Tax=Clostridium beijerinckii TaxID=1520 RepID=UPI001A9AA8BA|nr:hypothetical protein [Clostridium beijerinckii]
MKERDTMKKKNLFNINCISLVSLISIYMLLEYIILRLINLAFMSNVVHIFVSIFAILIMLILIKSGIGNVAVFISVIILFIFGYLVFAFTYRPEHIVEKDGKQMVAYVDSFLDVHIYYYDYINPIVRGSQLKIYENYGSGGYDPFDREEMPVVKQYIYYDEKGKEIKSSYMKN